MSKKIIHDIKDGVVERDETPDELAERQATGAIEAQIVETERAINRDENRNQRMQRAMARVMLGYRRNNDAGSWNKFLTDVMAKFDELGGDE